MTAAVVERLRFAALLAAAWNGADPRDLAREMSEQLAALIDANLADLTAALALELRGLAMALGTLPDLIDDTAPPRGRPHGLPPAEEA